MTLSLLNGCGRLNLKLGTKTACIGHESSLDSFMKQLQIVVPFELFWAFKKYDGQKCPLVVSLGG
eukprot:6216214-Amphidinium_carterae.1